MGEVEKMFKPVTQKTVLPKKDTYAVRKADSQRQIHDKDTYADRKAKSQNVIHGKDTFAGRKADSHDQLKQMFDIEDETKDIQASFDRNDQRDSQDIFDPYFDNELKKSAGGLDSIDREMNMMLAEEKQAIQTPLNTVEVEKLESGSKTLLDEITSGLGSYGKNKFWRSKKFFTDKNGF